MGLYVVTMTDGTEEKVTAQMFQVISEGSLAFGNIVNGQPDVNLCFNSRVWSKVRKSTLEAAPMGGLKQ